ncbi:MAG: YARHG domain-containing protein [Lachnospiraceae bacterium]|nr:YARHG domain-containing protein [Lachnospiraceae bacterium]
MLPYSDSCYLSEEDIEGLSDKELRLARNEIYARHGRKFKDKTLQKYFDEKSWYEGEYEPDEFQETWLSLLERKNAAFLLAKEKGKK